MKTRSKWFIFSICFASVWLFATFLFYASSSPNNFIKEASDSISNVRISLHERRPAEAEKIDENNYSMEKGSNQDNSNGNNDGLNHISNSKPSFDVDHYLDSFWPLIDSMAFSDLSAPYSSKTCEMIPVVEHDKINFDAPVVWQTCPNPGSNQPTFIWNPYGRTISLLRTGNYNFAILPTGDSKSFKGPQVLKWENLIAAFNNLNVIGKTTAHTDAFAISYNNGQPEILFTPPYNNVLLESSKKAKEEEVMKKENTVVEKPFTKPNVIFFILDSIPRSYVNTYMPRTVKWLRERQNRKHPYSAFNFVRFHSQPGSTMTNMTPMLSNKKFTGDTFFRYEWKGFSDPPRDIDWIQSQFQSQGYLTMMVSPNGVNCNSFPNVMSPKTGFEHVMPGVLKTCAAGLPYNVNTGKASCVLDQFSTQSLASKYYKQMISDYSDRPSFAYFHLFEGHDSGQMSKGANARKLGALDQEFVDFFTEMEQKNDTVILFGSDHGSWKVHNRPFLHMLVPQKMFDQTNDPDMLFMRMFQNQLALLGGYDIYRTMYHLSVWPVESPPIFESNKGLRPAISLFESSIPEARTCEEARIPLDHCFCEPWVTPEMRKYVPDGFGWLGRFAIQAINSDNGIVSNLCPRFSISKVQNIGFKEKEMANGIVPWQLEIVSNPGDMRFHFYVTEYRIVAGQNDSSMFESVGKQSPIDLSKSPPSDLLIQMNKKYLVSTPGSPDGVNKRVLILTRKKQVTRYHDYKSCTPKSANPEFCHCAVNGTRTA